MEKLQAKGELGEEELRALEQDITGRVRISRCEWHPIFIHLFLLDNACLVAGNPIRSDTSTP
jgi:hypothetical protein